MKSRVIILLLLVVLPGLSASLVCGYYLLPEWAALEASYKNYRQVSQSPNATEKDVFVAKTAQEIHRINCFAEGMGLLLGAVIFSVGIHGLCTLPKAPLDRS